MTHITEKQVMERHTEKSGNKPLQQSKSKTGFLERAVSNSASDYVDMLVNSALHSDESLKIEEAKQTISDLTESVADLKEHRELLEFQLNESKDNAAGWKREFKKEYECSAMWRDRFLEAERQRDQFKEQIGIELKKQKEAEGLMDEALIAAYQDEKLAVALAAKFVAVSKRNMEVG
ncbi:hypothetical protein ACRC6Q_16630 [Planococcus sp. SE5232]|uniref:hypothetical protein n=1 Tax=unclassified Planococcus (in: firmicutes) TaxID=2662419 RepID=UPI003D6AB5E8